MNNLITELDKRYKASFNEIIKKAKQGKIYVENKVNVAGFDIKINDIKKTEIIHDELLAEKKRMQAFRESLQQQGIKPLAVVPKKIFQKMIAGAPFYTFKKIDKSGEVRAQLSNLEELEMSMPTFVAGFFASVIFYLSLAFAVNYLFFIGIGVLALSFALLGSETVSDESVFGKILTLTGLPILYTIHIIVESKNKSKDRKKLLWPDNTDTGTDWVKILLPTPPDSVKQTLVKCYRNNIKTYLVVHEKGFGIDSKELKQQYNEKYDPMICTENGEFMAVLDQFGDIPEEKRLIELMKKNFKSLPEELGLKAVKYLN